MPPLNPSHQTNANANTIIATKTPSQQRIEALSKALTGIRKCTREAHKSADNISRTGRVLNSLTSPATDHSAKLAAAARNLQEVQLQMTKAREMMDCVVDCEPPISQLFQGAKALQTATMMRKAQEKNKGVIDNAEIKVLDGGASQGGLNVMAIKEVDQDVIDEAKIMMEAMKDAYLYFDERKSMRNSDKRMDEITTLYHRSVKGMCILISVKLSDAGKAVRLKKSTHSKRESAQQTRDRLTTALNDRTLLQSVGEYEEFLPFNRDEVHFQRVIFETLGDTNPRLAKLARSASISSPTNKQDESKAGPHTKVLNADLDTRYMHLDTYAKSRKLQAYNAIDGYYRKLNNERKEEVARNVSDTDDFDLEARDVVRCFEHAMVVIVGEQVCPFLFYHA